MIHKLQLLFAAALLAVAGRATPTFAFDGAGGALTGAAGSTVGWGFTVTDSTEFVLIQETAFCQVTVIQVSQITTANCAPTSVYDDFSGNIPIIGPSPDTSPLTEHFNAGTMAGFGSFTIASNALPGTTNGQIVIVYDTFSTDPFIDPNAIELVNEGIIAGNAAADSPSSPLIASITVTGAVQTPEPGGLILIGLGLAGIAMKRLAMKRLFPRGRPAARSARDL
jgi:hypothetical protein